MTSKLKLALATACCMAATAQAAGTDNTHTIAVSSTVNTSCVVTTGALAFPAYDPVAGTAVAGTGSFSLKCTKGAAVTVGLDNGTHVSSGQRQMVDNQTTPTNFLQYNLFLPTGFSAGTSAGTCPGTTPWTTTSPGGTLNFTSVSAASNTVNVCGTILANQDVAAAAYTDTVTIVANF